MIDATTKMATPKARNVTPIIAKIRDFFNQRKVVNHLRFEQTYTPRTQPLPTLPPGVSHKMSTNYYFSRDGRRESEQPTVVFASNQKQLPAPDMSQTTAVGKSKVPQPGPVFHWD